MVCLFSVPFKNFSFSLVLGDLILTCLCVVLSVWIAWGLLNFLDVCIYNFHYIWKAFWLLLQFFKILLLPLCLYEVHSYTYIRLLEPPCSWVDALSWAPSAPSDLPSFVSSTHRVLQTPPGLIPGTDSAGQLSPGSRCSSHRTQPVSVVCHCYSWPNV